MEFREAIQKEISGQIFYETDVLKTSAEQRYKIVINQGLPYQQQYEVNVFVEVDPRLNQWSDLFINDELQHIYCYSMGIYSDWSDATNKVSQVRQKLASFPPDLTGEYHYKWIPVRDKMKAMMYPDYYFWPGDHVAVKRNLNGLTYYHTAIYVGNGYVIQLSDPTNTFSRRLAHVNENNWANFHDGDYEFVICMPIIKYRSNGQVLGVARSKIGAVEGQYSLLFKNCHHFTNYCQFGTSFMRR